ncbi:GSCFA domain-containing protein [Flavobacterium soyangense]|uniref:GSCFA domain-containing protein n=1 Tax=Flavobacterium soyangense TaxID=2023265 RepID=A0A930UBA0_9FLAO|nr:GSCFA domain-containing protein [Flavobacterium soyangense]MBF2708146.1 GSCFA domain-containing protein [Flavobacterium soyangense]
MQFRTQIPISKSQNSIDYNSKIVSFGSCFAENIAEKLDYFKFQNTCNPFGIIFNPVSIEKIIRKAVNQELFTEKDIFFHNECWYCFNVHSDLSNTNKDDFLNNLNQLLQSTKQQLQEASYIIITYGTSWVYRNLESNSIVANCHKVPQREFKKEILSVEIIENSIKSTISLIQKVNPKVNIIFTVSPVRHLKDGFVENQVSKANLITAIYKQLQTDHCKLNTEYFPSYEIMMDELRDYRFYADDMLHPSKVAVNYIWERFSETTISEECHSIMNEVETIQKRLAHRPFNPNSESHKKFLDNLSQKINALAIKFSHIEF